MLLDNKSIFELNAKLNIASGTYKVIKNSADKASRDYDGSLLVLKSIKNILYKFDDITNNSEPLTNVLFLTNDFEDSLKNYLDRSSELKSIGDKSLLDCKTLIDYFTINEHNLLDTDFKKKVDDFISDSILSIETLNNYNDLKNKVTDFTNKFKSGLEQFRRSQRDNGLINEIEKDVKKLDKYFEDLSFIDILSNEAVLLAYINQLTIVHESL